MKREGQKMKLFALRDIFERETDEHHGVTMARILELLSLQGYSAERKSIYDDIHALQEYGLDIIGPQGREREYVLASRLFDPDEVKLLVDAVHASKFLSEAKTRTLVGKLKTLCSKHAGFYGSGCERVSEGMDAHLFKFCRFQSAVEGTAKVATFIGCTNVGTEHKVIGIPRGPLGQACLQLNDPLGGEQFLHLFGERDGSPPGFCFGCTGLQTCTGGRIIGEVAVSPDGLLDREAASIDVRPPQT